MKTKTIAFIFLGLTALVVVSAVVIYKNEETSKPVAVAADADRIFDAKGRVVSVEAGEKTIHIAHETIPDFMPAMTMPFSVKDAELLRGLAAGDQVKFQLVVTKDDSWIATIQRVGEAAATAIAPQPADDSNQIKSGEAVPDFSLVDENGQPLRLSQFHSKAVLVTFIYTRCPVPNFCPLLSQKFSQLQTRLAQKFPDRFQLVSVSFDPQFDTPEVLKNYGKHIGANPADWHFATGSPAQISQVTGMFGLIKTPEGNGFSHDLRTALISPEGKLIHIWRSNVWTPEEVESRVQETLEENPKLARMP